MQQTQPTAPHERLLQTLSDMHIHINSLASLADRETATPPELRDGLAQLERATREALDIVRASVADLLPIELEGATLPEALSHLVEETAETLGLSSRLSFSGIDEHGYPEGEHTLSPTAERMLFLVAREALYQLRQRSDARRLRFSLNYGHNDVQMSLEDDGVFMRTAIPSSASSNTGVVPYVAQPLPFATPSAPINQSASDESIIHSLRARIEQLGGTLTIAPQGERGTRILVRLPYIYMSDEFAPPHAVQGIIIEEKPAVLEPEASPETQQVRILLVESQSVTRAGLRRLLESYPGLQVIGEASDGVHAVSETLELGPQVVLMDAQLAEGQSLEALRQIKQLNLNARVLLLSSQDREEYLYEALRAGADGYLLKDIAPDELANAIRSLARGELHIQSQLAGKLLSRISKPGRGSDNFNALTTRELEVLRLLARGLRNKEIAARLFVSERTVNFHLANIYQKLNVSGRTEALSRALEQGLITV